MRNVRVQVSEDGYSWGDSLSGVTSLGMWRRVCNFLSPGTVQIREGHGHIIYLFDKEYYRLQWRPGLKRKGKRLEKAWALTVVLQQGAASRLARGDR